MMTKARYPPSAAKPKSGIADQPASEITVETLGALSVNALSRAAAAAATLSTTWSGVGGASTSPKQPQLLIGVRLRMAATTNTANARYEAATSMLATQPPTMTAVNPMAASTPPPTRTSRRAPGRPSAFRAFAVSLGLTAFI